MAHASELAMTFFDADSPQPESRAAQSPHLPAIWIGYVLGVATIIAEYVAITLHPELEKQGGIPPLYLFVISFVGGVYWLVCIHRVHVVIAQAPGWKHPISPARAVGFHFIPFYQFYWIFKWPAEIAKFVNSRLGARVMKPTAVGVAVFAALILRIFDPGFGLILLFFPMSYVSECVRRALAAPPLRPAGDQPSSQQIESRS
jgi:hypothetical protein